MRDGRIPAQTSARGFSLVELAVVMAIVAFLLGGMIFTLSAQVEQRNFEETRRRLEQARELVLAFAIVNGRLPCPARSTSAGAEVRVADTDVTIANRGKCQDAGGIQDYYGGALAGPATGGLLPAQTIGFLQVDSSGFAVDSWGNPIRYAVARTLASGTCSGTSTLPHFTNALNLRSNGITCQSGDLIVCKSSTAAGIDASASPPTCGAGGANQIMTSGLVVATIFSTGKNYSSTTAATSVDEATNLKTNAALSPLINALFVWHTPTSSTAASGEFDDQMTWITVGELYGKLISAGILP